MSRRLVSTPAGWGVVVAGGGVVAGDAAATFVGVQLVAAAPAALACAGAAVMAFAVAPLRRLAWVLAVVPAAFSLGLARGGAALPDHDPGRVAAHLDRGAVSLTATVREGAAAHRNQSVVVVDVQRLRDEDGDREVSGSVVAVVPGTSSALAGDRVTVTGSRLRRPDDRPGALSAATLERDGVTARVDSPQLTVVQPGGPSPARAIELARAQVRAIIDAAVPEPSAALVGDIALGLREPLTPSVSAPLQDAGLIHLVATSGLKVALVVALLARVLGWLTAGPRARLVGTLVVVGGFVLIAGGSAAAIRSAVMASAALTLRIGGRRPDPLPLLALTAAVMIVADPALVADVGFQLSFLGTAGIVWLADPIAVRLPGPRLLVEPLAVTVAAQALTVPVMASTFGVVSLAAPLANALAVPLTAPLLVLAWSGVAAAAVAPVLGAPFLWAAGRLAEAVELIARGFASVPGAALHVGGWPVAWTLGFGGAVVVLAWGVARVRHAPRAAGPSAAGSATAARAVTRRAHRLLVVAAVSTGVGTAGAVAVVAGDRPDGRLHVAVLDVGAAPAVLITTADGGTALVDGGSDPTRLGQSLGAALSPTRGGLDLVVLTGGERNAVAGLSGLAGHRQVGRVIIPDADLGTAARAAVDGLREAGADVLVVRAGTPWSWGGAEWRLLAAPAATSGAIAPAAVLQVADPTGSALLLGDLPASAQDELAGIFGPGLRADLVISAPGSLPALALIDAARPRQIAVPARGRGPAAPRRAPAGVRVRDTASDGTLRFAGGPAGLEPR